MSNAYKMLLPNEAELAMLTDMSVSVSYRATNLTSARLRSLENRGYVTRGSRASPNDTQAKRNNSGLVWILTVKGRLAVLQERESK